MRRLALCVLLVAVASAAAAQPITPIQQRAATQHYRAGLEFMSAERWDRAADEFQAAIAIDRQMAWAHYNLGQCRMAQRRYVEAGIAYERSIGAFEVIAKRVETDRIDNEIARRDEINEINDSLRRSIPVSALTRTRMEDKIVALDRAANRDLDVYKPVPAEVYLAQGSAYHRQNKLAQAERAYLQALQVKPQLGAAYNNLAVVYLTTGRLDDAEQAMRKAKACGTRVSTQFQDDLRDAQRRAARAESGRS